MKKNIFSILLLLNIIIFGFVFNSYKLDSKVAESPVFYIVEYSKGSNGTVAKTLMDKNTQIIIRIICKS